MLSQAPHPCASHRKGSRWRAVSHPVHLVRSRRTSLSCVRSGRHRDGTPNPGPREAFAAERLAVRFHAPPPAVQPDVRTDNPRSTWSARRQSLAVLVDEPAQVPVACIEVNEEAARQAILRPHTDIRGISIAVGERYGSRAEFPGQRVVQIGPGVTDTGFDVGMSAWPPKRAAGGRPSSSSVSSSSG